MLIHQCWLYLDRSYIDNNLSRKCQDTANTGVVKTHRNYSNSAQINENKKTTIFYHLNNQTIENFENQHEHAT